MSLRRRQCVQHLQGWEEDHVEGMSNLRKWNSNSSALMERITESAVPRVIHRNGRPGREITGQSFDNIVYTNMKNIVLGDNILLI